MATAMNSSLNKSQSLANLGSFKLLQVQFVDWAATWAKTSDLSIPSMAVDMPDIVTLLQALGYKLRKLEAHQPHDVSSVSSVSSCDVNTILDRGVRVVVTCGHSGQVCVLESPLAADKCRCTKVPDNDTSGDCFWEVTAVGGKSKRESNLIESGCDALPNVSKEINILVANVLNYLCERINGNKELEQVEIPLRETPVSSKMFGRYSDSVAINTRRGTDITQLSALEGIEKFRKNPSVAVSSPHNDNDSPTRYRSLDTLTSSNAEKLLPEPGHLIPKDGVEIQKSMDALSIEDPRESSTSTIGDRSFNSANISKLKEVHKLIQTITASVEQNNFSATNINKVNQVLKIIADISVSIRDNNINATNLDKLKKVEKMIADIIKKVDKKDTSTDKEKRKSNSASSIIQKIIRAPMLPLSAQARTKVSNSSPNLLSNASVQPKQVVTIKKRNRIESSSSVVERTEVSTVKRRPIIRSSTDVANKQPTGTVPKKTINKYANIKSTIPKPEPCKRKD